MFVHGTRSFRRTNHRKVDPPTVAFHSCPHTVRPTQLLAFASFVFDYICPANGEPDQGNPAYLGLDDARRQYHFQWVTSFACPVAPDQPPPSSTSTPSSIAFVIFFTTIVVLYLIGGAVYQYNVKDARGADLLYGREHWAALASLVGDGVSFSIAQVSNAVGASSAEHAPLVT